ncbi:hypothetical protein N7478_010909 [Penicillium angulare]|uniref:uncharacterized protein n=1 Tax=Penicillium angulare TaxID=116970 RepID=UPI002541E385|nr:uncharacterized protein N7478_010909 [Penicillium angulare]KAJ5263304.1 hypothetical protein N7478_010909 [Penicillium angulare]
MSSRSSMPHSENPSQNSETDQSDNNGSSPPSSSKRPRQTPTNQNESSEDESAEGDGPSDQEDEAPTSAQTSTRKRARLNPPSDDESEEEEGDESEDSMPPPPRKSLRAHPGLGPDGYKPGAIVRIKVVNFVTYTEAEFFPGPKLNMVIGPNGTGKSTLVCAICLGLGWGPQISVNSSSMAPPKLRSRLNLRGTPGTPRNPVISRMIKRDGNKSSFTLNGHPAPKQTVLKLAQGFAIQVDNLCQFLPQDKVAEFAALTPIELLHSTERAAAGQDMVNQHDALKKLRGEQKDIEMNNRGDKEMLSNLENRQEMQRADVERMRQRAEVQEKIDNLDFLRPWVEYREYHRTLTELKEQKTKCEQEQGELEQRLAPAMAAVDAKESYLNQVSAVKEQRETQVQQLSDIARAQGNTVQNLDAQNKELNGEIDALKKSNQKTKDDAYAETQKYKRLKRQQEEEPVEFDPDYYNEQLKQKRLEAREIEERAKEINRLKTPLAERKRELQDQVEREERQLRQLDSEVGRQENKLANLSQDTLKAYRWVLQNQDKFEKEVFGPPIVTCSIKNPRYADIIESLFQKNDFTSFTTQSRNDFRTLQRALDRDLKLSDITIKTCSASLESMTVNISNEELKRLGFEGWAKDFIQGPDPVLAMLCSENGLHRTPVGLNEISNQVYEELVAGTLASWVAGKQSYKCTRRREYGPGAVSTRVNPVRPARYWTSQPVDASVKQQHRDKIRDAKAEEEHIDEQMNEQRSELGDLGSRRKELHSDMDEIEKEKAEKQTAHTQYRAIPEKLAAILAKKTTFERMFKTTRERVAEIRGRQDEVVIRKAEAAIEYADAVENLREAFEELVSVEVKCLEAHSDLQLLNNRNSEYRNMKAEKSREVGRLQAEYADALSKGRGMRRASKRIMDQANERPGCEELCASMAAIENYGMDEFNAEIDSARAQLELTQGGSASMIKEFEEREQKIEKLRDKLASFQEQLDALQGGIDEVRAIWEPRLDALISKISDAFSDSFQRIGCAGQVSLDKVEAESGPNGERGGSEFDQWSIQIHVKFREHESLSLLDSHRQSGGERAVSTIFYLMALQSLSASPFRVVDEINQGMDPRNERMVHGRLVDIACASTEEETDDQGNPVGGSGGGQYFLITPKLLTGLSYKPGMRVLTIWSGEHMPKDHKLNVGRAIRLRKEMNAETNNLGSSPQVGVYA